MLARIRSSWVFWAVLTIAAALCVAGAIEASFPKVSVIGVFSAVATYYVVQLAQTRWFITTLAVMLGALALATGVWLLLARLIGAVPPLVTAAPLDGPTRIQ